MEIILQPWPWFVGGPLIALTLFLYFYFGKNLEHQPILKPYVQLLVQV